MKVTGWVQASDYSSLDLGCVDLERATDAVRSFPWADRAVGFCESVVRGEDACPPGIGFSTDTRDLFHVYCETRDTWQLHVQLARPGRILGLIRKPSQKFEVEVTSLDRVIEILSLFFNQERERLASALLEEDTH